MSTVTLSDLSYARPDGPVLFDGLNATFGPGAVGLIGANGAGKTTLLRLIAGRLRPARGSVTVSGRLGYLHQDLTLATGQRVATVLGLDEVRNALHRIESGDGTTADFDLVDGRWDVEERAIALLGRLGLPYLADTPAQLDRRLDTLSGGETELLGLVAELLREPDALLLDEPTNNLDSVARERLWSVIAEFTGTVLVAGHDRELLDRMDSIAELRRGEIRMFGGNFEHYEDVIEAEQLAAQAAVRDARSDVRKQAQELIAARTTIDRRRRYGQKMFENKREPKIVMGLRKRAAQESAGKLRNIHLDRVADAREQLAAAEDQIRDDREIRIDLPDTRLYSGQQVVALDEVTLACGPTVDLIVTGPERIAITGRNGIGKTTLLQRIIAEPPAVPWRLLPQRLDIFDEDRTVADNVRAAAPGHTDEQVRAQLARFLFRGAAADVPARALSGGERLRAALAVLLLADPAPRLLLLDEPTNNLDLPSLAHLTEALAQFQGALIVVSHDQRFLAEIGITRQLELTPEGLSEARPVQP